VWVRSVVQAAAQRLLSEVQRVQRTVVQAAPLVRLPLFRQKAGLRLPFQPMARSMRLVLLVFHLLLERLVCLEAAAAQTLVGAH